MANPNSPIDLRRFPFDRQKIQIVLEDKKLTEKELVYSPEKSNYALGKETYFPGWEIERCSARPDRHYYPDYDETYSQHVFELEIRRVRLSAFLKTFLPVIFIMLGIMTSFFLGMDKAVTRLAMVSSGLVACVMFHVSIQGQIPPVGYLTFADKFMVVTYFILLVSFAVNAYSMVLQGKNKNDDARKLHRADYAMFFVVPALYAGLFLLFL